MTILDHFFGNRKINYRTEIIKDAKKNSGALKIHTQVLDLQDFGTALLDKGQSDSCETCPKLYETLSAVHRFHISTNCSIEQLKLKYI